MRIAFLLPDFVRHGADLPSTAYRLAEELDRRGHQVDIFHPALPGTGSNVLLRIGATAWVLRRSLSPRPVPWHTFPQGIRAKFVGEYGASDADHDIVVGFGSGGMEAAARQRRCGARFGFVDGTGEWSRAEPAGKARIEEIYRCGLPVLTGSVAALEMLRRIGVKDVRSGLPAEAPDIFRPGVETKTRDLEVCLPVRPGSVSDDQALLDALRLLREGRGRSIRIWGFGNEDADPAILELLDEYHRDPTDGDLLSLFSRTALFVVASRRHGLGSATAQALAAGCTVVGFETGGVPSFCRDGENCRILPHGPISGLVGTALELLVRSAELPRPKVSDFRSAETLSREWSGSWLESALELAPPPSPGTASVRSLRRAKPRIVFVHTAGIDRPPEQKSGTDIAVADLLREVSAEWPTLPVNIPVMPSPIWTRHIAAFHESAMPVIVERLAGAPSPGMVLEPGDRIVLADDYAGLLLGRGWRPAAFIRHNAFHDSYAKVPRSGVLQRIVINYHSGLARKFDRWTTHAALGVVAPAGTTENLLRKLSPTGRILPWRPIVPLRQSGPFAVRPVERLRGIIFANFDYAPNMEALEFLCDHLAPALEADGIGFRVAGPAAVRKAAGLTVPPNVEIHGFQPDIEAFASECDFGILPIFQGEGILLKTLTMMSWGLPIVATSKAAAGTGLKDGESALLADDLPTMLAAIRKLSDPDFRKSLGASAWTTASGNSGSSGVVDSLARIFRI